MVERLGQERGLSHWRRGVGVAAAVLALGLLGTALTVWLAAEAEDRLVQERFERAAQQAVADINSQFRACTNIIASGVGLVQASRTVSRDEWRTFAAAVRPADNIPGLRGLAYVAVVREEELDGFVATQRARGSLEFTLRDADPGSPIKTIVTYIEPQARNEAALGLNSLANPVIRDVITRAVESGVPSVSDPVWLVQAPAGRLDSVAYAPVFRAGVPTSTPNERWAALSALVAAPLDLIGAMQVARGSLHSGMRAELLSRTDDGATVPMAAVGIAADPRLEYVAALDGIGRDWELRITADHAFVDAAGTGRTTLIGVFGLAATLLASTLVWSLATTRHRAQAIAASSVLMLRRSTDELRAAKDELERKAEELERSRIAAESASAAKSDFLANMSHEIRTPITALIGFADLLLEPGLAEEERASHIATIQNSGRHLLAIVNNVLDLSKIEAGQMAIESIPTDARRTVREVIALFNATAASAGVALSATIDPDFPQRIVSDPTRLRQILVNLVGNAVKFTPSGSIAVTLSYRDGAVSIGVRDTGVGLTQEQIGRLFRSFSQADASMSRRFGGTGLGLVISRRLCELLGGTLTVESTPGHGSFFTARFLAAPADPPETPAGGPPTPPSSPAVSARILVVEDGPDNQRLLRFILQKHGLRCVVVENGRLALDAVESADAEGDPFRLILMDMQMPVMDGYTATAELRRRGCRLPIIALTAHAMSADRQRCLDAGCDDYATKPFDRARLLEMIAGHTDARACALHPGGTPAA